MSVLPAEAAACELPPLKTIQSILRKTTEALAHELPEPSNTAPDWSPLEWACARAVVTLHGVSPLLAKSIHWQGPPGWNRFLAEQRAHTEARYPRIVELLQVLDSTARHAGIPFVALKGAALHSLGIYTAGERPMADVDILLREQDAEAAAGILESLQFRETLRSPRHRVFEPAHAEPAAAFGENSANALKIEMHTHVAENLPLRTVDLSARLFPSDPHPGRNDYPSSVALMSHLLLHAAGGMALRLARLLHLHDISQLASRLSPQDWGQLTGDWWAYPPLALTARYYPASIPPHVLEETRAHCPLMLRHLSERQLLSDVSLSYVWVNAFPGIEWSRSVGEMIAYMSRRAVPSRSMKKMRQVVAQTAPTQRAAGWNQLPQSRRIVRWLISRQARSETLFTVRAALTPTH